MYLRPTIFAAFAGKFPGDDYIDARHSRPPAGDLLDANLGRFPLICTSAGVSIGQSSAVHFYIASLCGLLGSNATETALVLSFPLLVVVVIFFAALVHPDDMLLKPIPLSTSALPTPMAAHVVVVASGDAEE